MRISLAACLIAVTAVGAPSQTTHLVGPGGYSQIRDAVAFASPGDIIEVQPGFYWNFHLKKHLTIRAQIEGTVDIGFDPQTPGPSQTVIAAPGTQPTCLVGLNFLPSQELLFGPVFHALHVLDGIVTIDNCTVRGAGNSALKVVSSEVHLQDCVVESVSTQGTALGVEASFARITCVGGEFLGGPSTTAGAARQALLLNSSLFHGSGFLARGGSSGAQGSSAVQGSLGAVWISDAVVQGGVGACAFVGGGGPRLSRTSVLDNGTACPTAAMGNALIGVDRPAPLRIGNTFSLTLRTVPFDIVVLVANTEIAQQPIPLVEQPLVVSLVGLVDAGFVVTGVTGVTTAQWAIPADPNLIDLRLWFQAARGLAFPLQVSPVVGGVIRP